jgi:hypothetical protein
MAVTYNLTHETKFWKIAAIITFKERRVVRRLNWRYGKKRKMPSKFVAAVFVNRQH